MNLRHFATLLFTAVPALASQPGARELYNEGVSRLGKGELRERIRVAAHGNGIRKGDGSDQGAVRVELLQPAGGFAGPVGL